MYFCIKIMYDINIVTHTIIIDKEGIIHELY